MLSQNREKILTNLNWIWNSDFECAACGNIVLYLKRCVIVVVWLFFCLCKIRLDFLWKKSHDRILFTWTAMCNHILSTISKKKNKKKKTLWNYAPNEKCREILSMTCAICILLFKLFIIIGRHSRPEGATHITILMSCSFLSILCCCFEMRANEYKYQ